MTRKVKVDARSKINPDYLERINDIVERTIHTTSSNEKQTLNNKFKKLLSDQRPNICDRETIDTINPCDRVSVIGDIEVNQAAINALAKGPKFNITPNIQREHVERDVQTEIAVLAYSMRWKTAIEMGKSSDPNTRNRNKFNEINSACPFKNRSKTPVFREYDTESKIYNLQQEITALLKRTKFTPAKRNIKRQELAAIKELRDNDDITVTRSDKGGEIVVMKTQDLLELNKQHLADDGTYERLDKDPTEMLRHKINKTFRRILENHDFPHTLTSRLMTPPSAKRQQFYGLPKTHKQTLKIRPIVSARGGIFDRLGWFLQYILKHTLQHVSAHVDSTRTLNERFDSIDKRKLKGKIPISFDVVSLYTNIDVTEAVETIIEYVLEHKINRFGLHTHELVDLLYLLLNNNTFYCKDIGIFRQIRGLAMGNRLSGTLAIVCMDKFEKSFVYKGLRPKPPVYVRYVDDTGTVAKNSEEAQRMLEHLNSKHQTIRFELELPDSDGYLPILNIRMKIEEDGTITRQIYTKPANKGITIHYQSHQPTAMKKAIIKNEFRTARENCSRQFEYQSLESTSLKYRRNGYPTDWLNDPGPLMPNNRTENPTEFTFRIPYINDSFNHKIKSILKRNNINARLINIPNTTIRQLTRKRETAICKETNCPIKDHTCAQSFVVYKATCELCNKFYVGSTSRELHVRAKEHNYAVRYHKEDSALGEHYKLEHQGHSQPSIRYEVLKRTSKNDLRLRIEEALQIQQLSPPLNRRQEETGITYLPTTLATLQTAINIGHENNTAQTAHQQNC